MSTITSFFVAPSADVSTYRLSQGVPAACPSVLCDYLDELKVALLENLLTGREPAECMKALTAEPVYRHDESGIEVFPLGDNLVQGLAKLSGASPVEQAKKWMAMGHWGRFGRRAGDLRDLVDMLASIEKLATVAASSHTHRMFLWVCP